MKALDRVTIDPAVMGGKACIRGLRVTVGTVVGLLAVGRSPAEILKAYPYLEREDIDQSLAYAAWRLEEREVPLSTSCSRNSSLLTLSALPRPPRHLLNTSTCLSHGYHHARKTI